MALYDNNDLLGVLGGQNLGPTTPYNTLQNYQQHGQQLLNSPPPTTFYSPWQAVAYALKGFEGRNEQDSAQRIMTDTFNKDVDARDAMINAVKGFQAPMPQLPMTTGSIQGNIPQSYDNTLIQNESGGDPTAKKGSHRGLGQFGPDEEKKYGIDNSNWTDPVTQTNAINAERKDIDAALTPILGRAPTNGEAYLAHQQGIAGAGSLLTNGNEPAYKALTPYMSENAAKQHIAQNIDPKGPLAGVPVDQITSAQFAHQWTSKFDNQQPQQTSQNITTGSNPESNNSANPEFVTQQRGMDNLLQNLSFSTPPVEPPLAADELKSVHNLSPADQKLYLEQRSKNFTPETFDVGFGTFWKIPGQAGQSAQVGFIPKTKIENLSVQGLGNIPTAVGLGAGGNLQSQYLIPGANTPSGQGGAATPGANNPQNVGGSPQGANPTLANPNVQSREVGNNPLQPIINLRNQVAANERNNQIQTERDQASAKDLDTKYRDLQNTFANNNKLLNSLKLQRNIIDDPKFYSGTGANKILDINKLADSIGLDLGGTKDRAQAMQAFSKFRAEQNLTSVRSLQGLGAIRNPEIDIITASNGDLSNTPDALRAVNEVNTRIANRDAEIINQANQYKTSHGGYLDNGWYDYINKYQDAHPLFTDKELEHYHTIFDKSPKRDTSQDGISVPENNEQKNSAKRSWQLKNGRYVYEQSE